MGSGSGVAVLKLQCPHLWDEKSAPPPPPRELVRYEGNRKVSPGLGTRVPGDSSSLPRTTLRCLKAFQNGPGHWAQKSFLYNESQFTGLKPISTEEGGGSLSPREMFRLWSELVLKSEAHHPMGTQHTPGCHQLHSQKGPCTITIQMGKLRLEVVCPRDYHKASQ